MSGSKKIFTLFFLFIPFVIFSQGYYGYQIKPIYQDSTGLVIWKKHADVDVSKIYLQFECSSWNTLANTKVHDTIVIIKKDTIDAFYANLKLNYGVNKISVFTYKKDNSIADYNYIDAVKPFPLELVENPIPKFIKKTKKKIILDNVYTYKICCKTCSYQEFTGSEIDIENIPVGEYDISFKETQTVISNVRTR